jgi:hypothetical protein
LPSTMGTIGREEKGNGIIAIDIKKNKREDGLQ